MFEFYLTEPLPYIPLAGRIVWGVNSSTGQGKHDFSDVQVERNVDGCAGVVSFGACQQSFLFAGARRIV